MHTKGIWGVTFNIRGLCALWRKQYHLLKCTLKVSLLLGVNRKLIICTPGESGLINTETITFTEATYVISTSRIKFLHALTHFS